MSFPGTGLLILLIGAYFFFFAPRMLYLAAVFFIPFSATAVMNVGWGGGQKGISAWIFMAALWMVRTGVSGKPFWKHVGWRLTRRARIELLALLACAFVSLLVPVILNGTAWVEYFRIASDEMMPLRLDGERLTQTGYFVFGIVFAMLVAVENCDPKRFLQSVQTYIFSGVFVSLWAFFQLWCNLTGHVYPAFIFNTSMGTSAQLYGERLGELNLARVSSVAVEPSQLGFAMSLAFVLLLVSLVLARPVFTKWRDISALILVGATLAISTSTTAYLGVALTLCLVFGVFIRAGRLSWKYAIVGIGGVAGGVLALLTVPLVHDLLNLVILNKLQTGSGMERINSISLGIRYFLQYPILGTSWNAVNSADLVFEFLASLGLLGFSVLLVFLIGEFRMLWRGSARDSEWSLVLLPAVLVMLGLCEATGFPFSVGYVWFPLGLGIAAPFIVRRGRAADPLSGRARGGPVPHSQIRLGPDAILPPGCTQET